MHRSLIGGPTKNLNKLIRTHISQKPSNGGGYCIFFKVISDHGIHDCIIMHYHASLCVSVSVCVCVCVCVCAKCVCVCEVCVCVCVE